VEKELPMFTKWFVAACVALPLVAARGGDEIVLEPGPNGISVVELIERAREVTGEPFFFDPKDVRDVNVTFTGTVKVPRDHFVALFEHCLREVDFLHVEEKTSSGTLHSLHKLGGGAQARGQQTLKSRARVVTRDELKALADRNMLVTTTFETKNLPAREAVSVLNLYFAETSCESVRNIEGTDAILMTGFATNMAGLVGMLERLDASLTDSPAMLGRRDLEKQVQDLQTRVTYLERTIAKLGGGAPAGGK
jgi:type II secretory pathway component GspD/PulD (secretin)